MKHVILVGMLVLCGSVAGAVNISDVTVNPGQQVWMSEPFNLTAVCEPVEGADQPATDLYVDNLTIWSENTLRPSLDSDDLPFTPLMDGNSRYVLRSTGSFASYLLSPGTYFMDLRCVNTDEGTADSSAINFTVWNLSAQLTGQTDLSSLYAGEQTTLHVNVNRQYPPAVVGSNTDFTVTVDGEPVTMNKAPVYNSDAKVWLLDVNMPAAGTHDLGITVEHDGATTTISRQITVEQPLMFDVSVSKTAVAAGDTVSISIDAAYKGQDIQVSSDDVTVALAGSPLDLSGSNGAFTVTAPDKEPGSYDLDVLLEITVDGEDVTGAHAATLQYRIPVEGAFTAADDSGMRFDLRFRDGGAVVKRVQGRGSYSDHVLPGTYDVLLDLPHSRFGALLEVPELDVASWDNPVRYRRYTSLTNRVPGFVLAGLHAFRTGLSFDEATLELGYTTNTVTNPEQLAVFRCTDWNMEKAVCYGTWEPTAASFDAVDDVVTVETGSLGAFAVGIRNQLDLQYSLKHTSFTPDDAVSFTVVVQDQDGRNVADAAVTMTVDNTDIEMTKQTNGDGIVQFSFPAPPNADTYAVDLQAVKPPYNDAAESFSFSVERPARLQVVAPDAVRLQANTTKEVSIYVRNTGFRTIQQLEPVTDNVPYLQRLSFDSRPLRVNESRAVTMYLEAPADSESATKKAELVFSYDGKQRSTVFGVTAEPLEPVAAESATATGLLAGEGLSGAMPSFQVTESLFSVRGVAAVILFIQAGVIAFVLVRRRGNGLQREQVRGTMAQLRDGIEDGAVQSGLFAGDDVRRENVLRAMSQIKKEIGS